MDFDKIEFAVLVNDCNKYYPGYQDFQIPCLAAGATTSKNNQTSSGLANKNTNIGVNKASSSSNIYLRLPKEYTIFYPKKIIPAGTKFLVAFVGGDATKPVIIGRYDHGQS
jgi:hypothetical protein